MSEPSTQESSGAIIRSITIMPEIFDPKNTDGSLAKALFYASSDDNMVTLQALKMLTNNGGEYVSNLLLNISALDADLDFHNLSEEDAEKLITEIHAPFKTWKFMVRALTFNLVETNITFSVTAPSLKAAMYVFVVMSDETYIKKLAEEHTVGTDFGDIDNSPPEES